MSRARQGPNAIWRLDDCDPPKKDRIKLDFPQHAGPQDIIITLVDRSGKYLKFAKNPLSVSEDGTCPPPDGIHSDQIRDVNREDSKLTFTDLNQGKQRTLIYKLDFVDRKGNPVAPLDPEIKNGGNNRDAASVVALLLAGAGVAALAFFAIRALS